VQSAASRRTAYANLILNMLNGDATLFIRGDEAEESWRIIDPVMNAWRSGDVPMQEYAAGEPSRSATDPNQDDGRRHEKERAVLSIEEEASAQRTAINVDRFARCAHPRSSHGAVVQSIGARRHGDVADVVLG
jgi:hypothetical protein